MAMFLLIWAGSLLVMVGGLHNWLMSRRRADDNEGNLFTLVIAGGLFFFWSLLLAGVLWLRAL